MILFLDKIIYPDTYKDIIERITKNKPKYFNLKFIAFVPENTTEFKHENDTWPFSLSLVFDCISRVINRKGHATLQGDPMRATSVILEIWNRFKNFKISKDFFNKEGIHG